jgi:hypothetical protein
VSDHHQVDNNFLCCLFVFIFSHKIYIYLQLGSAPAFGREETPRVPGRGDRAASVAVSEAGSTASSFFSGSQSSQSRAGTGKRRREARKHSTMVQLLGAAVPEPSFRYKVKRPAENKDGAASGIDAELSEAGLCLLFFCLFFGYKILTHID